MKHKKIITILFAATLLTCEKIPDYCGKGAWYDPELQFCFALKPYNFCGGERYNPLVEGCIMGAEVGTRCQDESVVPLGTPCGGYTLSASATPTVGGIVTRTPGMTRFAAGEQVIINAEPEKGYTFVGWAGAITSKSPTETITMNANKPLVAMFRPADNPSSATRTLIAAAFPEKGGTITRTPSADAYSVGETVTVTATASAGYKFAGWSGDAVSSEANVTISMDAGKALVAIFTPVARTLTVNAIPAEAGAVFVDGTALAGSAARESGAEVRVLALPEDGYYFAGWSGAADGTVNPVAITLTDIDMTITANFKSGKSAAQKSMYPVTVIIGATGISFGVDRKEGEKVTISAGTPPDGQRFKNWTTSSAGVNIADPNSSATSFTMPGHAVIVTALFERDTSAGGNPVIITDSRDGKQYKTVVIGNQRWMAENLNYAANGSMCHKDDNSMCDKYGRLYTWVIAMDIDNVYYDEQMWGGSDIGQRGVCPTGWRLPSRKDWDDLISTAGGKDIAGKALKSISGWNNRDDGSSGNGTNEYGFSALPGGFRDQNGDFWNAGFSGNWWTATESYNSQGYGMAYDLGMSYSVDYFANNSITFKRVMRSVRCIAD